MLLFYVFNININTFYLISITGFYFYSN